MSKAVETALRSFSEWHIGPDEYEWRLRWCGIDEVIVLGNERNSRDADPKEHVWFVRQQDGDDADFRILKEQHSLSLPDAIQIALAWADELTEGA